MKQTIDQVRFPIKEIFKEHLHYIFLLIILYLFDSIKISHSFYDF